MHPRSLTTLVITVFATAAFGTACLEVDGSLDPDETAQLVCQRFVECDLGENISDQARQEYLADCIDLHRSDYAQIRSQRGDNCLDAHLETELCFTRQSCEDWDAHLGCDAELAHEEDACSW